MDSHHASAWGSYPEALTVFGQVTGPDPRSLGANEADATALGMSSGQALALQSMAYQQLAAVSEPETRVMLLAGLGAIGMLARRRGALDAG